jgi:DNA polymerase V
MKKDWWRAGLSDPVRQEKLMRIVPIGEVWDIGSRNTAKLN